MSNNYEALHVLMTFGIFFILFISLTVVRKNMDLDF